MHITLRIALLVSGAIYALGLQSLPTPLQLNANYQLSYG